MSQITKWNIEELVCKNIINQKKHQEILDGEDTDSKYQIGFYVIDLRIHIFQKRLWKFRNTPEKELKSAHLEEFNYTEENLAYDVGNIL